MKNKEQCILSEWKERAVRVSKILYKILKLKCANVHFINCTFNVQVFKCKTKNCVNVTCHVGCMYV